MPPWAAGIQHHQKHAGLLAFFGVGRVPVTVLFSLLIVFAWVICYLVMSALDEPGVVISGAVFVGAFVAGSVLASVAVRPLFPLFRFHAAATNRDLVGKVCTVTTGRVDERFGQASVAADGGGEHIIQVRAESPNALRRDSQAVILSYDDEREAFVIEGMDNLLGPGR